MATYEERRILQKAYPAAEWISKYSNHVLLTREMGYETDTGKYKMGDGVTPWASLAYYNSDSSNIVCNFNTSTKTITPINATDKIQNISVGTKLTIIPNADWAPATTSVTFLISGITTGTHTLYYSPQQMRLNDTIQKLYSGVPYIITCSSIDSSSSNTMWFLTEGVKVTTDKLDDTLLVPLTKGGTGATSADAARTNLGVPQTNHASTATTYGVATKDNYGHIRSTGMGASGNYAQMRKAPQSITNFNSTNYTHTGEYPIYFYKNCSNAPTTLAEDTGITDNSTYIYGILITYNYDSTSTISATYGAKQELILPLYGQTYERYITYSGSISSAGWVNSTQKPFEPPRNLTLGGRLKYMGIQEIPTEEIAFSPPNGETYLGQMSSTYGSYHVTFSATSPTITIKRYNGSKTQTDTKTYTLSAFTSASAVLDEKNGRVYVCVFHSTNYPTGQIRQYQFASSSSISSSVTNPYNTALSDSNWNDYNATKTSITALIAFNGKSYYYTRGAASGSYNYYGSVVCVTNTGTITSMEVIWANAPTCYTNGTDLYMVHYYYYSSKDDSYLHKYNNGNLSSATQLYYRQGDKTVTFYYFKNADMFIYQYVYTSISTPSYYRGFIKSNGTTITSYPFQGLQQVSYVADSPNFIVCTISNYDSDGNDNQITAGKGLGLIETENCELVLCDHMCAQTQSMRFDEDEVKLYVSQGNGMELIFTIEQ